MPRKVLVLIVLSFSCLASSCREKTIDQVEAKLLRHLPEYEQFASQMQETQGLLSVGDKINAYWRVSKGKWSKDANAENAISLADLCRAENLQPTVIQSLLCLLGLLPMIERPS